MRYAFGGLAMGGLVAYELCGTWWRKSRDDNQWKPREGKEKDQERKEKKERTKQFNISPTVIY